VNIQEFREQYPDYKDVPDEELSQKLYSKYYKDVPYDQFKQAFLGNKSSPPTGILSGFKQIGRKYMEEVESGIGKMERMAEKPKGRNVLGGIAGAVQYGMAPITAAGEAFRQPLETTERALGIPESVVKVTGEMASQIPGWVPYGGMVKSAMGTLAREEGFKAGGEIAKDVAKVEAGKIARTKPPLVDKVPKPTDLAEELAASGSKVQPVIHEALRKDIQSQVAQNLPNLPVNERERIGQQIVDYIWFQPQGKEIAAKYGMTTEELGLRLRDAYSLFGRGLAHLSQVKKQVAESLKDNPEALKFWNETIKSIPEPGWIDKAFNTLRKVENVRRLALITQWATAARNAESQFGRLNIGAADEALQGAIKSTFGGQGNFSKQVGEGLDLYISFMNRLSSKERANLERILNSEQASMAKSKLLDTPVHEVAVGEFLNKTFNLPNRLQENLFRKIAFESKLTQLIERKGWDIKTVDPKMIPKEIYEEAAQYGLDMTFASMPKSKAATEFVRQWAGNPVMTALFNPFPRFFFANALPFVWNFSPVSFMKAMNPKVVAELAMGNPDKFANHASKAIIGSMNLGMALYLRNSKYESADYYKIRIDGKDYDTRPFAPLTTPYLLVAEALSHPERLSAMDWAQAALSLNRIAGTGLVLTDILRTKDIGKIKDTFAQLAGQYLGGFTVPFHTFKDAVAAFSTEESKVRDVRQNPFMAPTLRNFPYLSQYLPEYAKPTQVSPILEERPGLKQATGILQRTVNPIEDEMTKINLDMARISPRTGNPEADNAIKRLMAPIVVANITPLLQREEYKRLPDAGKRMVLADMFSKIKQVATMELAKENPALFKKIKVGTIKKDIQEILEERGLNLK
jgi:hypothetical protein